MCNPDNKPRLCILSEVMNANELQIAVTQSENATVLSLSGRVSVDSSPMLRNRLLAVVRSEARPAVIVDLTKSPSVDCSGIATLIEALKIAQNHKVALRLTGLQGRLKNLFEVTGVLSLFEGSSHRTGSST
jgi:anti-anti-sigma factor